MSIKWQITLLFYPWWTNMVVIFASNYDILHFIKILLNIFHDFLDCFHFALCTARNLLWYWFLVKWYFIVFLLVYNNVFVQRYIWNVWTREIALISENYHCLLNWKTNQLPLFEAAREFFLFSGAIFANNWANLGYMLYNKI